MAFLLKVFSGSERLKEKQKSAALVNETFQAELNNVQRKFEVENYELQMLVEMIYDSSYPESQKFLKQPSKDRLYGHKETISSLLFGLAAQGVSVAPLILTHFQKHGCDAIADTLLTLLDLVRPLLASKDAPEFTSDDILDAIDVQWHSSVRSSPAFASLRGSTAASPLQSPRVSFSNLSPRQSFSNLSPSKSLSNLSPRKSISSPDSPCRLTQSFSFSPPSEAVLEGVRAARAPRRSLSSQYPGSEVNAERLQPLVEHEEETGMRKQDDKDEVCSREENSSAGAPVHSSSLDVEFGKGLSINIPRSATSFKDEEFGGDQTHEEPKVEFSHDKSVGDGDAEVLSEGFSKDILESEVISCDSSNHEVSEKDFVALPTKGQLHVEDSEQTVGDQSAQLQPRLEFSHEQVDKSVGDGNAEVVPEGFSGSHEDVLESEVPSGDLSHHEVAEKDNVAQPTESQIHVEDSGQTVNVEELNSSDNSLISKERMEGFSGGHEDILESEKLLCDLNHHEVSEKDVVAIPINSQLHVKDSNWKVLEEKFNSIDNTLISKEGMEGATSESPDDRAASLHDTEVEESPQGEQSLSAQGTKSSSWSQKFTSAQSHENTGDSRELEDNDMDKAEEVVLVTNNESSNEAAESVKEDGAVEEHGAMEGVKNDGAIGDGKEDGAVMEGVERDGTIMEDVEEDGLPESVEEEEEELLGVEEEGLMEDVKEEDANPLEPALIKDKEPSDTSSEAPNKEYSVEKSGVGEEEFQKLSDLRSIALSRTNVLSQSSFSDHYDGEETTESSSEDETSRSNDETDDDEETIPDEKKNRVQEGEHHLSGSSDEDQALRSQLDEEHVGNPELEQYGAALHSPSYNLVTFDLTKLLSRDSDKDIKGDMVVDDLEGEDLASGVSSTDHALGSKVPFSEQKATPAPVSLSENEIKDYDADLVESGTSLDVPTKQDSIGADLFVGEFHQRNESSHDDSEAFSQSEELTGSGDNQVNVLGENYSQDGAPIIDSAKSEDHLEAERGSGAITGNVSRVAEDLQMSHNDSEVFSSVVVNKFTGSGDDEVNNSGEKEEKLAPAVDSAKSEAEKGAGAITRNETQSAEDFEDMASHSQQDEGASSSNQYGLNLADRGDETSATNPLVPTKIIEEENGGTSDSPTIDEEDRNSICDQVDTEEGTSSPGVHFVDKTHDFQPKHVTEASPLPEELPIASVSSSELESQNSGQDQGVVLQSPEHDVVSIGGDGALVGYGLNEAKEKDLAVMLPTQETKQVLNYEQESSQEKATFVPATDVNVDETIHPSEDHEVKKEGEVPEPDFKSGTSTPFLEEDETKMSFVVESGEGNGTMEKVENQGSVVNCEQPGVEQPQSLEKENDVELVTGSATYGMFLHNTKFLDSQGNFVKALTAPVIMARHEPERHGIRDSLICTPVSNSDGTYKNGRRRRYGFLWTRCFTCYSKPSAL